MDSLTQIVLGASVGEVVLGKKVGNKALLWGAVAGTIPDLDVIYARLFLDVVGEIDIHRGFSHSIIFCVLASPLFGWIVSKIHQKDNIDWKPWAWLFFWGLFTHPLLDCFTTWGTQLFWPLDYRVAIQSIFVIDPFYTLPFLFFTIWVLFKKKANPKRRIINYIGLSISSFYLLLTVVNKIYMNNVFENVMHQQSLSYNRYTTKPTPLNNILWTANIETNDHYYIGYYSLLDKNTNITFFPFEKNHHLLDSVKNESEIKTMKHIFKDYYTVEKTTDGVLMNDLRFGLAENWLGGKGPFVFTYKITKNSSGKILITKKQNSFSGGKAMLASLWTRMLGN